MHSIYILCFLYQRSLCRSNDVAVKVFCASATRKEVLSVRHVIPALDTDHLLVAATLKFSLFVSSQRLQVKDRKMVIPEGAGGERGGKEAIGFCSTVQ